MNTNVMFSSISDEWETPQDLFDELNKKYHFTLDPCCRECNKKCYEENRKNNIVIVMLIPSRTDTKWFHTYIYDNPEASISFIKGRLKFTNRMLPGWKEVKKQSAPFPSMVVVFGDNRRTKNTGGFYEHNCNKSTVYPYSAG